MLLTSLFWLVPVWGWPKVHLMIFSKPRFFFWKFWVTSSKKQRSHSASWGYFDCLRYFCRGGYPIAALILYCCCFAFTLTWFFNRHSSWGWILQVCYRIDFCVLILLFQDVIGFFFCIYTICELRMPNFKMLTFLLIGFAIYDLFMVYVTPLLTPSKESGAGVLIVKCARVFKNRGFQAIVQKIV